MISNASPRLMLLGAVLAPRPSLGGEKEGQAGDDLRCIRDQKKATEIWDLYDLQMIINVKMELYGYLSDKPKDST